MIKNNMSLMQKIIYNIKKAITFRPVRADEAGTGAGTGTAPVAPPTPAEPTPAPAQPIQPVQPVAQIPMINYEQLIAQARQEEKAKLYPELTSLREANKKLTKDLNDALLQVGTKEATIQDLNKQIEEAKTGNVDPEEVANLKTKVAELETEVNKYKGEAEKAEIEKLRNAEIEKYEGKVIPELVTGTTAEEIAESVKASNARYLEITGGVQPQAQNPVAPQAGTQQPVLIGGYQSPTPANPQVAGVGFDSRVVTDSMIRSMSAQEYAQWRKQAGLK